jgi:hypothetical protein
MRLVVVYRSVGEHRRPVEDFLHEFERRTGKTIETLDPDSREGISFTRTYDIVEYPTVIALSEDGQQQSMWRGIPLPTISEVSYYA